MKQYFIFSVLFASMLLSNSIFAQDLYVYKLIGKSQNDVTKKYGKPVHKDISDPTMICMFYKSPGGTMIFVSDKEGVYQVESTVSYSTEEKARLEFDKVIQSSLNDRWQIDTVTVNDFYIHGTGVKIDLQLCENKLSKKFDVRVKANKSEE